jgi:N-sulfoglucosamine sulfohydrolase
VRTARFKYIRNDYRDLALTPPADAVRSPTFVEMRRLRDAGRLTAAQRRVFAAPRPAEELYDTEADPDELRNLAGAASHAEVLAAMRARLQAWQQETDDRAPAARTPDEFDREAGTPLATRKRPRAGKFAPPTPVP